MWHPHLLLSLSPAQERFPKAREAKVEHSVAFWLAPNLTKLLEDCVK